MRSLKQIALFLLLNLVFSCSVVRATQSYLYFIFAVLVYSPEVCLIRFLVTISRFIACTTQHNSTPIPKSQGKRSKRYSMPDRTVTMAMEGNKSAFSQKYAIYAAQNFRLAPPNDNNSTLNLLRFWYIHFSKCAQATLRENCKSSTQTWNRLH